MSNPNEKVAARVDGPGQCAKCGAFDTALFGGQCPRCLMAVGLEMPTESGTSSGGESGAADAGVPGLSAVARYRIIRQIGEGGMGVVYEAEQEHPSRTVALKVIKPGLATKELLRRFEDEAEALGRLQHPGIAQIYEAGTADTGSGPQPYFALEFVRGTSLTEYAKTHRLGPRERLALVAKVAEAAHHAHQRGLIHRDLKPGNILVDESGQPKIVDFGVARVIDREAGATMQTDAGRLIGTLAYMSPEQASADPFEVDIRTDVYALGVVLYELLAGRPPFGKKRIDEVIQAIREEEPARLSSVDRAYRGDIETIAAKALEKDKARRYTSAAELAADIGRYLRDEPIVARPASAGYQIRKFARRRRGVVVGAVLGLSALFIGLGAAMWQAGLARRAKQDALQERNQARTAEQLAREQAAEAATQRNKAVEAEKNARDALGRALTAENMTRQDLDRSTWQLMSRESMRVSESHTDDDLAALLARQAFLMEKRGPASQSGLVESALLWARWNTPWSHSLALGYRTDIQFVVLSRDGMRLATNGPDGSIALVDLRQRPSPIIQFLKGEPGLGPALFAAFSPDGKWLISGGYGGDVNMPRDLRPAPVRLWDLTQPNPTPRLLSGHMGQISGGMFSPDGKRFATIDSRRVLLWNMEDLSRPPEVLQPLKSGFYRSVAFSPDSNRLVTTDNDPPAPRSPVAAVTGNDAVRIWDARNLGAPPLMEIPVPRADRPTYAVFSPDGGSIAIATGNGVRLWDLSTPGTSQRLGSGEFFTVAFSPNGRRLAVGGKNMIVMWDLTNRSALRAPLGSPLLIGGHEGSITGLTFSPDSARLASGSADKTVRIWEVEMESPKAGTEIIPAPATRTSWGLLQNIAFSAGGERLFAASEDEALRAWDRSHPDSWILLHPAAAMQATRFPTFSAFSAGASRLAISTSEDESTTLVWDLLNPESKPQRVSAPADSKSNGKPIVMGLALSADGTMLAQATIRGGVDRVGTIWLWDLQKQTKRSVPVPWALSYVLAYSPDGTRFAAANQLETRVWDLRHLDADPSVLPPRQAQEVSALAFSPDGNRLAVGAEEIAVWDLRKPSTEPIILRKFRSSPFDTTRSVVSSVQFSPGDGFRLVSGSNVLTQIWDLRNPTEGLILPAAGIVSSVAFSSDGLRVAAANADGEARMWLLGQAAADDLCGRVWRNLSMDEWRRYVGESIPYEKTCPALPAGIGVSAR